MNLNLADSVELVFDRIFYSNDLGIRAANFVQRAVKSRRLTTTRRTGDQDNSVGQTDQFLERFVNWIGHPHAAQVKDHTAFIENTKNDAFAVQHRND